MKKKLLLICSLLTSTIFSNLRAQEFDVEFLQWFGANAALFGKSDAKSAFNTWKGLGASGTRVVQNGISAYVANRLNNVVPGYEPDPNPLAMRASFSHGEADIVIESPTDLSTIALQYRGSGDTQEGAFQISYGLNAAKTTTYVFPGVTSTSPGQVKFFNFPVDPFEQTTSVRYIRIQRVGSSSSSLYRIATSTTPFTTLPLEFLSFTAKASAIGNSVNLNWKTTNEVNTKEFVVERRTDTEGFKTVGSLASANTPGDHSYKFEDVTGVSGKVYYRIKQVDRDGKFAYSDVVPVEIKSVLSYKVYPNPATDVLNVTHEPATKASLKVFNSQGQSVISQSVANGSALTRLNTSTLSSGIYYLVLNNDGKQSSFKFVKN